MPYLYAAAVTANKTGIPCMRSMVMEFTEDKTCHYLDKQYMLGDSLLVAPIFNDQSLAEYYLPKGVWTDFFTGEVRNGGQWISETHGYLSIPLMVKENSIVVLGAHDDKPDYDYADGAEIRVYQLIDQKEASAVIYGMDNRAALSVKAVKNGNQIRITVDTKTSCSIRLVNVKANAVTGGSFAVEGNDTVISDISGEIVATL